MFGLEDILCEIPGECSNKQGLPPGFRFHPTDEELVTFFLASKVLNGSFGGIEIAEVDLNRCEPWELPDTAKIGEKEWYFFSLRDRKYPTGLRTNRATEAGYWKATGKDKEVYSASNGTQLIGMKKTLVFYKGRAPRGEKTKWVMHEYRLVGEFSSRRTCKDEWVICRMYHKAGTEKKGQLSKIHNYLLEQATSSYSTSILPPLLESPTPLLLEHEPSTQTAIQHPNFIHHEIVPKSLLMDTGITQEQDQLFSMGFQPSFSIPNSATTTSSNTLPSSSESILIKNTLFSHQVCTLKQPVASKIISVPRQGRQWKETTNFTHFQHQQADGNYISSNSNSNSNSNNNNNNNMNMQWVQDKIQQQQQRDHPLFFEMGCGFSAYADTGHEMSTSLAFSGDGFQSTLMDSYLREHGESGPLDA